ncbi:MAG: hypothetical protein IPK22_07530 [Verrucomicrobiaceae bacterium]|nr:hypothetical protein [Verrucomicrobiaceae bacterium]
MMNIRDRGQTLPANLPGWLKLDRKSCNQRLASIPKTTKLGLVFTDHLSGLDAAINGPATAQKANEGEKERGKVFKLRLKLQLAQHENSKANQRDAYESQSLSTFFCRKANRDVVAFACVPLHIFTDVRCPSLIQRIDLLTRIHSRKARRHGLQFSVRETTCRSDLFEHA